MFIVLLSSLVNASKYAKCVSLSNQKCKIQPSLINLHPSECSQEFHYYLFSVELDRCSGNVFNMITGMNESKTLTKDISFECKCRFDGRKCN